jgi:RNA polymerase sigma-70 factor (ECF subfamily)
MPVSDVSGGIQPHPPAGWTEADLRDFVLMSQVQQEASHDAFAELTPRLGTTIDGPLRILPAGETEDGRAEVHLRIWARRMQYREDRGTVRAWVSGVSRHYALDWLRKHSKAHLPLADLEGLAVADPHPGPAAAAEEADWAAHARHLCRRVLVLEPAHVQTSFELRMRGVSYAQIAAVVGRPIGTVASAVHRVRKKLLALIEDNTHRSRPQEILLMSKTVNPDGVEPPDLNAVLAQLGEVKADLSAVKGRIADVEDRVPAESGPGDPEDAATFVLDPPAALAGDLLDRVRQMIDDPAQHQSDADWAEVFDLAEDLRPFMKSVSKGMFVKVWTWLGESRELLKKVPGHGAALAQLRGLAKLLESAADDGDEAGGVVICR